jgi:hypothetical protein
MGNSQSLPVSKPRQEIIIQMTLTYSENMVCKAKKDKTKKIANLLAGPIPNKSLRKEKEKEKYMAEDNISILLKRIQQYPRIGINRKLLVARFGNFVDKDASLDFASSLKSMIINTQKGASLYRSFGDNTVLTCRFLKILVTNDDRFYLMPLRFTDGRLFEEWVEDAFTRDFIMGEINRVNVFSNILSIIKRQKQLINPNGSFIFCVEFKLNTLQGIVFNDRFHQDADQFGDSDVNVDYLSIINTSQSREYGYSTEIRAIDGNESYVMLTGVGDGTLIANKLVQHRVPKIRPINAARYIEPDDNGSFSVFHQSNLASIDQETLETDSTINKINQSLADKEPRHIIRILITELRREFDLTRLTEITDLLPLVIYISPIVSYEGTVFDRNVDANDTKSMVNLLKDFSVGGKSKKKRRKRKRKNITKRKIVRKNYSSRQRGGTGELANLKNLNEYFAIYTDPETACLVENNVEVII